jgi:hypothetical protein
MEEFFNKLHKLLSEDFKCYCDCSKCLFDKELDKDLYNERTICDILTDLLDYLEVNDI